MINQKYFKLVSYGVSLLAIFAFFGMEWIYVKLSGNMSFIELAADTGLDLSMGSGLYFFGPNPSLILMPFVFLIIIMGTFWERRKKLSFSVDVIYIVCAIIGLSLLLEEYIRHWDNVGIYKDINDITLTGEKLVTDYEAGWWMTLASLIYFLVVGVLIRIRTLFDTVE